MAPNLPGGQNVAAGFATWFSTKANKKCSRASRRSAYFYEMNSSSFR